LNKENTMNTTHDNPPLPTLPQLGKATGFAALAAAAILTVAVLPAEYGIDPTGVGALLGLKKAQGAGASAAPAAPDVLPTASGKGAEPVEKTDLQLRNDAMSITLQPGEGAEIKASIKQGQHFVFSWDADGPVKADMHGEPYNAKPNEFTTYWKVAQQSGGKGAFTAPFDGIHGWFWRNKGDKPVTIHVKVSGFQEKLYRPS